MEASIDDTRKALELGVPWMSEDDLDYFRFNSDTAYMVLDITDSAKFKTLDPELGYKKHYTLADTLQGVGQNLEDDPRVLLYGRDLQVPGPGE